jgi:ATP-dependent DNA ligase
VETDACQKGPIPIGAIPVSLPIKPPFLPMEARTVTQLPAGTTWQYEPKWDGFRAVVFKDGDDVELQSKSGKPMARFFPELVTAIRKLKVNHFVLDGEIVISVDGKFSFDDLLMRIHPAQSRINRLASERPASLIVFDMLVDERGTELFRLPLSKRRPKLEKFAARFLDESADISLSPATGDVELARSWLKSFAGNLDGIIAKKIDVEYKSGDRTGMVKFKRLRTADCVVGGFRYLSDERLVGSLLLGLYDSDDRLHHVGFTSGIKDESRIKLTAQLEGLIQPPGFTGRAPGAESRWSTERSSEWQPLRPKLVVEVQYDHVSGGRFRHGTKLLRWRPDKSPKQCTMEQIQ